MYDATARRLATADYILKLLSLQNISKNKKCSYEQDRNPTRSGLHHPGDISDRVPFSLALLPYHRTKRSQ